MSYAEEVRQSAMKIAGRYESLMQEYGELLAENRELKAKLMQQEQAYPLPDDLYPGSKDWLAGDYSQRVEWLHAMYESSKDELHNYLVQQEQAGWQPMTTAPKDGTEILVLCDGEMLLVSWRESQGGLYGEWYTGFSCADDGRYTATDPVLWARPPASTKGD